MALLRVISINLFLKYSKLLMTSPISTDRRGRDRMVVGCKTTYAISAYHHLSCEFESRSREVYSIQHYVIKFVLDLRQVDGLPGRSSFHYES
jgi:hypothetical protein